MPMDDLAGRKALIEVSGLKEGHILDIGMGDCGCMSFFLAKRGFNVIGIDRSPYAIHESRKDGRRKRFKGSFTAKLAKAENLPFKDNEFDAVFAYHSLHHMDNVKKVIDEMFRVCKEDGLILISDLHEKGKKAYEHEFDSGEFLNTVEKFLIKCTKSIRKLKTKYNIMFICKKQ
jgi:ubiquinone/menaquinone biosynthesis C-methylase UbiE